MNVVYPLLRTEAESIRFAFKFERRNKTDNQVSEKARSWVRYLSLRHHEWASRYHLIEHTCQVDDETVEVVFKIEPQRVSTWKRTAVMMSAGGME